MPAFRDTAHRTDAERRPHRGLLWFCAALTAFLTVRATTTLAAGASFETPGDGWRSIWQLAIVATLIAGVVVPRLRPAAVAIVGANYLAAAGLELFDSTELLGVVPVDMRDRIVHPLVGLIALAVLVSAGHLRPGRVQAPAG